MYLQKRVPEVSLRDRWKRLVDGTLLAKSKKHGTCSNSHQKHASDAIHPGAVITGLGQVKAAGIHNGQGRFCIHAAVVFHHVDLLAAHGSGSGHQLVFQMFLGHIFEITGVLDDFGIPGVILDQAQYIGFIDVAQAGGFRLGNFSFCAVCGIIGASF